MSFQIPFADRLNNVETSAIRELFKLLGKPGSPTAPCSTWTASAKPSTPR